MPLFGKTPGDDDNLQGDLPAGERNRGQAFERKKLKRARAARIANKYDEKEQEKAASEGAAHQKKLKEEAAARRARSGGGSPLGGGGGTKPESHPLFGGSGSGGSKPIWERSGGKESGSRPIWEGGNGDKKDKGWL